MKIGIFVIFAVLVVNAQGQSNGNVINLPPGRWQEDQDQREGLNNFLWQMGMNWFKRVFVTSTNWENTQNIAFEQGRNKFAVSGTKGPRSDAFNFELYINNATRTPVDLGELG